MEDVIDKIYSEYLEDERLISRSLARSMRNRNPYPYLYSPLKKDEMIRIFPFIPRPDQKEMKGYYVKAGLISSDIANDIITSGGRNDAKIERDLKEEAMKSEDIAYAFGVVNIDKIYKSIFYCQTSNLDEEFHNRSGINAVEGINRYEYLIKGKKDDSNARYGFNRWSSYDKEEMIWSDRKQRLIPNNVSLYGVPYTIEVDAKTKYEILSRRCQMFGGSVCNIEKIIIKDVEKAASELKGITLASYTVMQALCLGIDLLSLENLIENKNYPIFDTEDIYKVLSQCILKIKELTYY